MVPVDPPPKTDSRAAHRGSRCLIRGESRCVELTPDRRPVIADQNRRNRIGKEINAEIAEIVQGAIVWGWLAEDWKELT